MMGKLHDTIMIIGEGPTEFYYFNSLRDIYNRLKISPDYPKHTNIKELEAKISEGIQMGINHIMCVIDMDTKMDNVSEKKQYLKLKSKYSQVIDRPKKGIHCEVEFFETHRCTELFFLFYYKYTSHNYDNQESLINDLNKDVYYEKTIDFFKKCKGLHTYFEKKGGNLKKAVTNANKSKKDILDGYRNFTYSELGELITKLDMLDESQKKC